MFTEGLASDMHVMLGAEDYDDFDTSPYGTEAATYWTAYDVWEQEQVKPPTVPYMC